ncbi:MAG: FtsX-like permease family protein, partial [Balneolaceae bacterium]|nr:FtsX-like permease family protein [Balneolaceae bacterium]
VQIDLFENAWIYSGFVALALLVGLISGSYPALFLSSFKPVEVLKSNRVKTDKGVPSLRKVLVVVQFTISIVLIIGTLIAYNQLDFLRNKDLGAETGQVVIVPVQSSTIANNFETIRSELLLHSNIREVASSNRRIGRNIDSGSFYSVINSNGERISSRLSNVWVGWDFIDLYNIQMLYGRGFSRSYISDTTRNAVIINREAARVLDLEPEQAVGQEIKAGGHFKGTIVGVAEDFHFEALYNRIKPMVFIMNPDYINYVSVKIASRDIPETMHHIRTVWKSFEPERIFISSFLDQDLHKIYMAEERFIKVFSLFTGLAIFTACLGIFGLAMFTASQKTREIGIRKVLGATVADILELLTKEFMLLVGAAFIVAAPIAYLVMKAWLQQFPYKTSIDIEMFVISGLMTLVIAWLAVSWQSLKAAMMNPIDSLRHE